MRFRGQHNKAGDLWIIVDTAVLDCSKFADLHPGGGGILLDKDVAGKDATACTLSRSFSVTIDSLTLSPPWPAFFGLHRSGALSSIRCAKNRG